MAQPVRTYSIVPGQDSALATQKLTFQIKGTICKCLSGVLMIGIIVAVGIILLALSNHSTIDQLVGIAIIIFAIASTVVIFFAIRSQMVDITLTLDGANNNGLFTSLPMKLAKCCCLPKTKREFHLTDVKSVSQVTVKQQTSSRYLRGRQYITSVITYRVKFNLLSAEQYQPPIVLKQSEIQQIVQFFRAFNAGRQTNVPLSAPSVNPTLVTVGTEEIVYSLDAPYSYPAYPPYNPNAQQTQQAHLQYNNQQLHQQSLYAPPVQQQIPTEIQQPYIQPPPPQVYPQQEQYPYPSLQDQQQNNGARRLGKQQFETKQ
ncbi:MAG: hypothetical protein EZS28_010075 [Streblomastix strix]|uniref:Uncharacterized protein n=1 Tax=Streblomastix strix TaxID=222440 RepID=A0A5J4WHU8_9EUKA|nr:MAG: hypothetical protein EZS28_010075 [Streblomastix strix]